MPNKLFDLTVKTGSYMKDGEEKGRFENIGSLWQGNDGQYIVMKRSFNPAGVPFKPGSDSIFISMFEPKEDGHRKKSTPSSSSNDSINDDIPF